MAKIPGIADLGPADRANPTQPVATYDATPIARGAEQIAQGVQRLGAGIQQAEQGVAEFQQDQGRWDYAKAHSDFITRKIDLDAATAQARDFGPDASGKDLTGRYTDQLNAIRASSSNLIRDPGMRDLFMSHTQPLVEQGVVQARSHARALSNDAQTAYVTQMGDKTINQAVAAPDDATRAQLIDGHNQLIDGLAASGAISQVQAVQMKQTWAHQYATADVLARADSDPQGVINELRAAPGSRDDVVNRILQNEGTSKSGSSSASGAGQFVKSTWLDMINRYRPDLAKGRSDDQILALRADENLGREMTGHYLDENAAALSKQGLPTTPGNLRLAHFLGPGGAAAVLKADPNMPVEDALAKALGPDKAKAMVDANPSVLRGKLAGSVTEWSNGQMGGSSRLVDMLRPDVREQLMTRAMQNQQKQTVSDLAGFKQKIEDSQAEAMRTGSVQSPLQMSDFVSQLGADQGPKAYATYNANLQLGHDIQTVAGLSEDQQKALLQSYEPKPGAGFADATKREDALAKAIDQTRRARASDPEFKSRVENTIEEAGRTGTVARPVTEDEFKFALGDDAGAKGYAQYQASLRAGHDVQHVKELSPQEQDALLQGYAPQPGPDYTAQAERRDTVAKAIQQVAKERADDPAGFAATRLPATQQAYQAYSSVMSDPTATPAQRQVAARSFATTSLLEQQNIGVAPSDRQILPSAEVDRFNATLQQAASSDDPKVRQGVVATIQAQREMWGDEFWPKVVQQLSPKQAPLVRAIAAGADEGAMVRLLGLGKDDDPAKVLKEQSDVKFADLTKELNSAMAPFMSSLVGRQRDRDFPDYYNLAQKLAATYVRDDGKSASDAAAQAFSALIGDRYDFRDTYRIPKDKNASWTADQVQAGTVAARAQLEQFNVKPAVDDVGGLSDAEGDSLDAFKRDGVWVTSPDNTGLNMVYGTSTAQKFVRSQNGERLLIPWAKLAEIGANADRSFATSIDRVSTP